jgi:hypothetical protein
LRTPVKTIFGCAPLTAMVLGEDGSALGTIDPIAN